MASHSFEIRHGELIDITGSPQSFADITFVPAYVSLAGTSFSPQFDFNEWAREQSRELPLVTGGDVNAPWFLGRLMHLFNTENIAEEDRGEKSCFYVTFVAVLLRESNVTIPFECSDCYGRTSLMFSSDDEPPLAWRSEIATAFYGLMLDNPAMLTDYSNRLFHSGASVWIDFGVSQGEPYFDEQVDDV